ncbi:unnamed protein product [Durusdinium trenchii]|uniref:Uncharacterized protein n=1 Tax=Durusdinium trenchii TaxID=1381693 RepID=A0ABP0P6X7_9DINO
MASAEGRRFFQDSDSESDGSSAVKILRKPCFTLDVADSSSPSSDEPLEVPPVVLPDNDVALEIPVENCSDDELFMGVRPTATGSSTWKPGLDCGTFVGRVGAQSLSAQSQVLICNVLCNIDWLSRSMVKACLQAIRPQWQASLSKQSFATQLAGYMLGLPAITVQKTWSAVKLSGWSPEPWANHDSFENHCGGGGRKKKNVAPPVESDDEELEVQLRSDPKQETMERVVSQTRHGALYGFVLHQQQDLPTFQEPSFVVLLICFQDICRPISEHILTVQTTLEPWLVHRADEKCLNSIDELLDGIDRAENGLQQQTVEVSSLHIYLFIYFIVCSCCIKTLMRAGLVLAFSCSKAFKPLMTLFMYLPQLMMHSPPIFKQVKLSTDLPQAYTKGRVLGPHCQCASRHFGKKKSLNVRGKQIRLPPWSATSFNANRDAGDSAYLCPRFQESKVPTPGTSKPGTFRHAGACSRCFVPMALYTDFRHIMRGLSSAKAFVNSFKAEMSGMLGPVGVNDGMISLQQAMSRCWNWEQLIVRQPMLAEIEAFQQLDCTGSVAFAAGRYCFNALKPFLKNCLWPGPEYPMKRYHWDLDDEETARQYKLLCYRVRLVARDLLFLHAAVVCSTVMAFAGHAGETLCPPGAFAEFDCKPGDIVPVKARLQRKRKKSAQEIPMPVRFCRYGSGKRLVEVLSDNVAVNSAAVSAAIDASRFFAIGDRPSKRTSAWHSVRVHHRSRLLRGAEAICEHLGSLAHFSWQSQREEAPALAMSRVHLLQADVRCLGSVRDEVVIQESAKILLSANLNPLRKNNQQLGQIQGRNKNSQESGRMHEFESADLSLPQPSSASNLRKRTSEFRAESLPSTLPAELKAVVDKSKGVVESMPLTALMQRDGRPQKRRKVVPRGACLNPTCLRRVAGLGCRTTKINAEGHFDCQASGKNARGIAARATEFKDALREGEEKMNSFVTKVLGFDDGAACPWRAIYVGDRTVSALEKATGDPKLF